MSDCSNAAFDSFLSEISAEHDISGYRFVAVKAWNAAKEDAALSCQVVVNKCQDAENQYGANAAGDCSDAILSQIVADDY